MSATDEVTAGADGRVSELIDARIPRDRAETVRAFAKAFTRRLSPADLAQRSPDELFGIVSGAF